MPVRASDEAPEEGARERRVRFEEPTVAPASASETTETERSSKRTRGSDTQARYFYVVKRDVIRLGPTPRCPGSADVLKGTSAKHPHNDECRADGRMRSACRELLG